MTRHVIKIIAVLLCFPSIAFASKISSLIELKREAFFYPELVEQLYPESQLKWGSFESRKNLENQLGILILADLDDKLEQRYYHLQRTNGLDYDLFATDTLLYLLSYQEQLPKKGMSWLFGGRLKGFAPPSTHVLALAKQHFDNKSLLELTKQLQPQSDQYADLYSQLYEYYDPYHESVPKLAISGLLKPNKPIPYKALIQRLNVSGELNDKDVDYFMSLDTTIYHDELVVVVKAFQKRHGLKEDGVIGKGTLFWLNMDLEERVRLIALNIQRLRMWENKQSRFVLVNIPSYEMGYFQNGKLTFKSKVIVGKPKRKTPLFTSRLDAIVFNPNWTVPTKIMKEDILPKVFRDPTYLSSHNYDVIPSWRSKESIPLQDIAWNTYTADSFPYKLRQRSGSSNALGRYKFNTPNNNAIYLHDTPSRSLFNKSRRAYSSGCIRVERASEFAQLLMKESSFSRAEYKKYHKLPETKTVSLRKKIAVYTIYQTAWVDSNNTMQFRNDVYKYDQWSKGKN